MSRKRHTPEQIISKLREAEVLLPQDQSVPAACKRIEVSEQTYYRWRKEWGGLRLDQDGEGVRRSIEWLIKRLIKVGARVSYHAKKWHVHVASAFPLAHYYRAVFDYG